MTRRELNAIRHSAYLEWVKGQEAAHLLATTNDTTFGIYRISEGDKVKLLTLTHPSQLNAVTLANHGFTLAAKTKRLFTANRQTKTLS